MQLYAQNIDLAGTPLPAAQTEYFMVSLNVRAGTIRPRTIDFLLTEHDARVLWGLRKANRLDTQFTILPSGQRHGFLNIERVHFDDDGTGMLPAYQVSQVHKIVKFSA